MRILKLMFVCMCLLGLNQLVWSQNQPTGSQTQNVGTSKQAHGIAGYLDPRTGTFTTKVQRSRVGNKTPGLTEIVARLIFTFNIVYNDQPASATTACTVDLDTSDSSGLFYSESSTAIVAKGGATCTVTVLFDWLLATPTQDQINVSYHIDSFDAVAIGSAAPVGEALRSLTHSILPLPVPPYGKTITEPTISVYL
jgi:hypothetical protein